MSYHCNVTGNDCLEKDCKQWNHRNNTCKLFSAIGQILYQTITGMDVSAFLLYLEEIRPTPRTAYRKLRKNVG